MGKNWGFGGTNLDRMDDLRSTDATSSFGRAFEYHLGVTDLSGNPVVDNTPGSNPIDDDITGESMSRLGANFIPSLCAVAKGSRPDRGAGPFLHAICAGTKTDLAGGSLGRLFQ